MIVQTFPDVVWIEGYEDIRLVTHAARCWMYENTLIKECEGVTGPSTVPEYVEIAPGVPEEMAQDGLVIRVPKE